MTARRFMKKNTPVHIDDALVEGLYGSKAKVFPFDFFDFVLLPTRRRDLSFFDFAAV